MGFWLGERCSLCCSVWLDCWETFPAKCAQDVIRTEDAYEQDKRGNVSYDPLYSLLCAQVAGWGKKKETTQNVCNEILPQK